jgi:CheY-like chemotaxis protein
MMDHDSPPGGAGAWRMRVLVVEDHPRQAESIAQLLRQAGHDAEVAADGPSAAAAAEARPPDVVLLDIGLPGMDGWQLARRLKNLHGPKPPLIVAVTGYDGEEDRRRSREAGIDLHLTKPVDVAGLEALLARFRSVIGE